MFVPKNSFLETLFVCEFQKPGKPGYKQWRWVIGSKSRGVQLSRHLLPVCASVVLLCKMGLMIITSQIEDKHGTCNSTCSEYSSFRPYVHLKNSYMDERDVPLYTAVSFKLTPLVSPSWVPKEDFLSGMGTYLSPKPCVQLSKWDQRQLAQRLLS